MASKVVNLVRISFRYILFFHSIKHTLYGIFILIVKVCQIVYEVTKIYNIDNSISDFTLNLNYLKTMDNFFQIIMLTDI